VSGHGNHLDKTSRRLFRAVACLLCGIVMLPAGADPLVLDSGLQQVSLLELYTSQGCSSCPPAERWLNAWVDDDRLWTAVVPVALHVDYWDYLGWADPYASAANSERQRDLVRAGLAHSVYTPGFFLNGREWRGWTLRVPPRASGKDAGSLVAVIDEHGLTATFPQHGEPLELHVVLLGCGIESPVTRGENRNRTLRQEFVALTHDVQTSSDGRWRVALPATDAAVRRLGIALWVSPAGDVRPLQATGGWLPAVAQEAP